MLQEICEDEDKCRRFVSDLPEEVRDSPKLDAEGLRDFVRSAGDFDVSLDRNWTVGLPLQPMIAIAVRCLLPRHWAVMRARRDEHFVTGDCPLTLIPTTRVDGPIIRLDAPQTIAMFPVDRQRALIGKGEGALRAWPRGVAAVNRTTAMKSHRHVYSSMSEFQWEDDNGRIIGGDRYLALGKPGPDVAAEAYQLPTGLSDGPSRRSAVRLTPSKPT